MAGPKCVLTVVSVLRVLEIYALENMVLYIAVYGPYKPYISIYSTRNVQTHLKSTVSRGSTVYM